MTAIPALTLLCLLLSNVSAGLLRCSQVLHRPRPIFQLIRSCSHSESAVLASDRLTTLEDCTRFATQHKALALNFANPRDLEDEYEDTCFVYDCPDSNPSLLKTDSIYNYHSVYADIDPNNNLTCVPRVGMFQLHREIANFSEAANICEWEGSQLARVISADRTNHLSSLVASLGSAKALHFAYVGMHDSMQEGAFQTVADEPLNCFEFQGWSPGEPRSRKKDQDCVVLDSRRGWRVVNCAMKLPFLCELVARVPDPCLHVRNKKFKQRCLAEAEMDQNRKRMNVKKCKNMLQNDE